MRILSAAGALPAHYYTQQQVVDFLGLHWQTAPGRPTPNLQALSRFHHRVGVDGRYYALPLHEYAEPLTFGQFNDRWIRVAQQLGEQCITLALKRAGLDRSKVDALITVSVTGIASPSLDALLINRMQLPLHIRRTPIFGLGCVAGAAGITQAADYVRAYPDRVAVLLSVELCSLTWQRDDLSTANLIASGLFGDGAAAVILAGADVPLAAPQHGPHVIASRSNFFPNTEDTMGWHISERGFTLVLSPDVPSVIQQHLASGVDAFLAEHNLTRADIGSWIMHTGGPKVLDATIAALDLPPEACAASWESLRKVGNLSSASVLFVLEEILQRQRPAPGTLSVLAAMGPGFCSELVLLRW
jgi:alkylresorcinol/alkylpyrone synthase